MEQGARSMEKKVGGQCSAQQLAAEAADLIEMEKSTCGVSYEMTADRKAIKIRFYDPGIDEQ